jgi:AbiV family abortive infection protein
MSSKKNKKLKIIKLQNSDLTAFRIATFHNAKRLLSEADFLFVNNLFPTSTFLSISSIEEMGKFYLSRICALHNDQNKLSEDDLKTLTYHPPKQLNSFLPPIVFKDGHKLPPNISKLWELITDKQLMPIRNNCLYVGFDKKWTSILLPQDILKEEACYFLETAYEVILIQIKSLLSSLDCTHDFLFLRKEEKILQDKLRKLKATESGKER